MRTGPVDQLVLPLGLICLLFPLVMRCKTLVRKTCRVARRFVFYFSELISPPRYKL